MHNTANDTFSATLVGKNANYSNGRDVTSSPTNIKAAIQNLADRGIAIEQIDVLLEQIVDHFISRPKQPGGEVGKTELTPQTPLDQLNHMAGWITKKTDNIFRSIEMINAALGRNQ